VSDEQQTERNARKVRTGVVISEKMDKTVLVRIDRNVRHALYAKTVKRSSKLAAHDEANDAHLGDTVRVMETRPIRKTQALARGRDRRAGEVIQQETALQGRGQHGAKEVLCIRVLGGSGAVRGASATDRRDR
jgi:small subunit ribosomal protein S17